MYSLELFFITIGTKSLANWTSKCAVDSKYHVWDQSQVSTVWNTRETGDIYEWTLRAILKLVSASLDFLSQYLQNWSLAES